MRFLICVLIFCSSSVYAQNDFFALEGTQANGNKIKLSAKKGRKILVATFAQNELEKDSTFNYWDNLVKSNRNTMFILIPALDMSDSIDKEVLNIKRSYPAAVTILNSSLVKKDQKDNQSSLVKWLTSKNENMHFDIDLKNEIQYFIISESGVLSAVLEKGISSESISEILKMPDPKEQIITR